MQLNASLDLFVVYLPDPISQGHECVSNVGGTNEKRDCKHTTGRKNCYMVNHPSNS